MTSSNVIVDLPQEMERKVAVLVQVATQFDARIHLLYGNRKVNAKSIMGMMTLALDKDDTVTVQADGKDEKEAVEAISKFLKNEK